MKRILVTGIFLVVALFGTIGKAHADGSDQGLMVALVTAYDQVQSKCTPNLPPSFQGVRWTGAHTGGTGRGMIIDADPRLGGPFSYMWSLGPTDLAGYHTSKDIGGNGYWLIKFDFC